MKYLARLKSEKQLPDELPKPPKPSFDSFDSIKGRPFPENEVQEQGIPITRTTSKVDWLQPCSICAGRLFTESDRGGYFCCECQTLQAGAKPAMIVEGSLAVKPPKEITKLPRKQVICQAYEQNGFLMSTKSRTLSRRAGGLL